VLRIDDRGSGKTTGEAKNATSMDYADDVLIGIEYLKEHKGIDIENIGLVGHSEGGVIAPLAAIQSKDVAFIVSLAGVGIKGSDLMTKQIRQGYSKLGLNEEEVNEIDSLTKMMMDFGEKYTDKEELKSEFAKAMKEWLGRQPDDFLLKVGFKGPN